MPHSHRRRGRPRALGNHRRWLPQRAVGRAALVAVLVLAGLTPVYLHAAGTGDAAPREASDPLGGQRLYVVPDNPAELAAAADPADADELRRISSQPTALWITDDGVLPEVARFSRAAAAEGRVPTFVLYAIPHRDCGSFSAGGFATAAQYVAYVDRVKAVLGQRRTIVIVEPDALPELQVCGLDAAGQSERLGLIRYAATTLSSPTVHVYLEAGGRYSGSAQSIASRLRAAGIGATSGFALDVSGFDGTADEVAFGGRVSALVGGSHFVIDTSRNGRGIPAGTPTGAFCNVAGLGLGPVPTTETDTPLVDAYLWVKYPGQSDGACGGGAPRSGVFWLDYALQLVRHAAPADSPRWQ